jgi:hypothetical protein
MDLLGFSEGVSFRAEKPSIYVLDFLSLKFFNKDLCLPAAE